MAVRGLGGPVRFVLTGGQRGDCPQAHGLIEGLPTDVFIADAAYDADPLREAIAEKDAIAVIPNNPSGEPHLPFQVKPLSSVLMDDLKVAHKYGGDDGA